MNDQQDEAARRFADVSKSVELETKDQEARARTRKIALALAPVFDVACCDVRYVWETCEDPIQELSAYLMPELRVYQGAPTKWLKLVRGISQSPVWKFFVRQVTDNVPTPVVVFRVSGHKEFWVMTARQSPHEELFEPRILVPVKGTSNNVFIMPMDTFIKEYSYG